MNYSSHRLSKYKDNFVSSSPFDHIVIDNFLDERFAARLSDEFPKRSEVSWWMYDNPLEKKLAFDNIGSLGSSLREFFLLANSDDFLDELRELTGIKNLISDPHFRGGGLHMIMSGGKLDIHEDFNIHKQLNAFRRINLIFYLNKDWDLSWGGNLELWNKEMTECMKSIAPIFNRAVIFRTDQSSNHGHPDPLLCPEDRSRISLAVYYYEPVLAGQEVSYRSTVYKRRPNDSKDLDNLRERRQLGRIEDKRG